MATILELPKHKHPYENMDEKARIDRDVKGLIYATFFSNILRYDVNEYAKVDLEDLKITNGDKGFMCLVLFEYICSLEPNLFENNS